VLYCNDWKKWKDEKAKLNKGQEPEIKGIGSGKIKPPHHSPHLRGGMVV